MRKQWQRQGSQRGLSNHKAQDELGKPQGIKQSSTQVPAQPGEGYTRSCGFTTCMEAGSWANLCSQSWERGEDCARLPDRPCSTRCVSSPPVPAAGRGCCSVQCLALPRCAQPPEKVRHTQPAGHPCLYLHALRAILASSCFLPWPEPVGNGVGEQRDAAGPRQADPTLAALPGVSERPSRVSLLRCS